MDNPVFVDDENIPLINDDEDEDYDKDSRYDTPNTSRIEETSFTTEQPAVSLRQRQRLLRNYIERPLQILEVDPGNVNLVDTKLF